MASEMVLVPYVDSCTYMVFVDGEHVRDIPYALIASDSVRIRKYTLDEARGGISYAGAEPGREHCVPLLDDMLGEPIPPECATLTEKSRMDTAGRISR